MYQTGQRVTIDIGNHLFSGEITAIHEGELQITCPIPLNFGDGHGKLVWPDGRSDSFNIQETPHYSSLVLRMPLPASEKAEQRRETREFRPLPKDEGRRSVRLDCQLSVRIQDLSNTFSIEAKTVNLSAGGLQLVTEFPLIVGRDYTFILDLEGEMPLKGRVLRKLPDHRYAVKFLADAEVGLQLMRRLFKTTHKPKPPAKRITNFRRG